MMITDDGRGFDFADATDRRKGLGLVSITERARLAGGTVSIVTEMKKGTRLCVRIPANALMTADPTIQGDQHEFSLS